DMRPAMLVMPTGAGAQPGSPEVKREGGQARTIQVTVTNNQKGPLTAAAWLRLPAGWRATPASAPVTFAREDEEVTVRFAVTTDAEVRPGEYAAESTVTAPGGVTSST